MYVVAVVSLVLMTLGISGMLGYFVVSEVMDGRKHHRHHLEMDAESLARKHDLWFYDVNRERQESARFKELC